MTKQNGERSELDIIYEEYLRDDQCIEVDGKPYYRIIQKSEYTSLDGFVLIVIPQKLFHHGESMAKVKDENGNVFKLTGPASMRFHSEIPRWYLETYTFMIKEIKHVDEIGDFVAVEA